MAITVANVIEYARIVTDHDSDTQVTDAQLIKVVNTVYQRVRRKLALHVPQLYRKNASFTATGDTQDVTGAPLSLTDFGSIWRIRRLTVGGDYEHVSVANEPSPDNIPTDQDYVYLMRGTVIEFFPTGFVSGQTFEIAYLSQPVAVTLTSDVLDVPEGFQECLGEYVASKIRLRFEEPYTAHVSEGNNALRELLWDLSKQYGISGMGMNEVTTR